MNLEDYYHYLTDEFDKLIEKISEEENFNPALEDDSPCPARNLLIKYYYEMMDRLRDLAKIEDMLKMTSKYTSVATYHKNLLKDLTSTQSNN
jgi:hypothetical protein